MEGDPVDGTLHRCSPLAAWISIAQCTHNASLARRASRRKLGDDLRLIAAKVLMTCPGCPGILARGEGTRYFPQLAARSEPAPTRNPRRRALVAAIHASGWKPPEGTVTVADLERMTGRPRRAIYRMLQHRKIEPAVIGRAGRPACFPAEAALEAARCA